MEKESAQHEFTNRLAGEKSPYLLQHAHNPVDWYPWGNEAFDRAKSENKPVFVSIGYATCHWCHVMEKESFEDEEVARLMNDQFVSIKVDREERPDIDGVYMSACQTLTGRGGWPLSVFMTPEGKPFYAGTYFPKRTRMGITGFMEVLSHLGNAWKNNRDKVERAAEELTGSIQLRKGVESDRVFPGEEVLRKGAEHLGQSFDSKWGGFGEAPKFPSPHQLTFLLRWHRRNGDSLSREMVVKTLDAMHAGGIYDHIGYGFCRYSVDSQWLVPHFEKMLYDQALLVMAYTEAYQAFNLERFARTVREIAEYVMRGMTAPEGAFFSAEDADSEGKEGLFYLWKPDQVIEILGPELGKLFCSYYDIRPDGNFEEGFSIPHRTVGLDAFAAGKGINPLELENRLNEARRKLFEVREERVHPLKDDKILTSWNGLMIAALAKAAGALKEPSYAEAARSAADFLLAVMRTGDGTLLRRYRDGETAYQGYLDDYAFFTWGLIELYETTLDAGYLREAVAFMTKTIDLFWDQEDGGFFFSGRENERLVARDKDAYDGAIPSGNSVALLNLLRLSRMTGDVELEKKADLMLRVFGPSLAEFPKAFTQFLNAVDFVIGPAREIVIVGPASDDKTTGFVRAVQKRFLPNSVVLGKDGAEDGALSSLAPFTSSMQAVEGRPTVYVCENYACRRPITEVSALEAVLDS